MAVESLLFWSQIGRRSRLKRSVALRAKANVPFFQSDHHDIPSDYDHDDHVETGDDPLLAPFSQKHFFYGVFPVHVAVCLWSMFLISKL